MKNGFLLGTLSLSLRTLIFHTRQWIGVCILFVAITQIIQIFQQKFVFLFSLISYNQNTYCVFRFFFAFFYFRFSCSLHNFFLHSLLVLGSECTSPKALFISFYEYQKEGENLSITNFFHIHKMFSEKYFHHKNIWRKMHLGFTGNVTTYSNVHASRFSKVKESQHSLDG